MVIVSVRGRYAGTEQGCTQAERRLCCCDGRLGFPLWNQPSCVRVSHDDWFIVLFRSFVGIVLFCNLCCFCYVDFEDIFYNTCVQLFSVFVSECSDVHSSVFVILNLTQINSVDSSLVHWSNFIWMPFGES